MTEDQFGVQMSMSLANLKILAAVMIAATCTEDHRAQVVDWIARGLATEGLGAGLDIPRMLEDAHTLAHELVAMSVHAGAVFAAHMPDARVNVGDVGHG